ncbi:LysR family transcriptional regulator [Acidomonas methanolica]|uniref:LysR family transcriptional regulator n=1 Tax=Acidomonas methanolica TaxID=437 RepID=UPI00211A3CDF|nr:LysR family transcriptional regulator [Acidomonas methanolica]MCQ9156307.1 LysR family transcriptional regulator [Acidomonas methanolica]
MHPVGEMEVFIEVVRHGGFSAAGRRLGIAPSVIADRVAGLEKRLGVRLLTRTTRRQALTEAGAIYLDEARAILASVADMEQRVADKAASPSGVLKVTAPPPLGRRWIAPFIGGFVKRYPDISVHLTLDDRFADIVHEGFDIAIRGGPVVDSSLIGRRLFETRRVVVAGPDYLALRGIPTSPDQLADHSCLVFNSDPHLHAEWRFGRGDAARNLRITGALAATNSELPVIWALAGLGLTQKSWWEVAEHVHAGRLMTVLDDDEPDPATFFAIHPVGRSQSRKIALFIDALIPALRHL